MREKSSLFSRFSLAQRLLAIFCVLVVIIGVLARFYRLSQPESLVFDEIYFPVFAWNFLHGTQSFDVHPPLGKLIIAIGELLWGNNSLGWRMMPALFGSLLIGLVPWLWWRYAKDKAGALFLLAAVATEPFLITYSREGLMDGLLLFFVLAAFFSMVIINSPRKILWPATLLGLACAIKWIGLGILPVMLFIAWRRQMLKAFSFSLIWSAIIYATAVLTGSIIGRVENPWVYFKEWHQQAYNYQITLSATHPWGSKWWSWPFMLRPLLMSNLGDGHGNQAIISAIGNPLLWYSSTIAVVVSLLALLRVWLLKGFRQLLEHPLLVLVIGYFSFYIPMIFIGRVMFIYHYLPSYAFALLMLAYWVGRVWQRQPELIIAYTIAIVAVGIFFFPMAMGWPALSPSGLQNRLWLDNLANWWQAHHFLEGTSLGNWLQKYVWSFSWYRGAY